MSYQSAGMPLLFHQLEFFVFIHNISYIERPYLLGHWHALFFYIKKPLFNILNLLFFILSDQEELQEPT